jgi:SAM-dependent methyltransferase
MTEPARDSQPNLDRETVAGFGDEWSRFTQRELTEAVRSQVFDDYFSIFPWETLPPSPVGADIGCGSGRWAVLVAPRVGKLLLFDASPDALSVARENLAGYDNVECMLASVDALPVADGSLDFAYSLGVLHHVPDTAGAIASVGRKLKPGAPFLVYLYYAFDNRGPAYRAMWKASEILRRRISAMPHAWRYRASQAIAALVYWPLARSAWCLDRLGVLPRSWPLAYYRDKPFYVLRTDALDRFGTRLEQRFSRREISDMLEAAGFGNIRFSDGEPFWCACATKI